MTLRQMRPDLRFGWLTPAEVMDRAYDLHVTQDPHSSEEAKRVARVGYNHLLSFEHDVDPTTPDGIFYAGMCSVVVSYGNAITRHKQTEFDRSELARRYEILMQGDLEGTQHYAVLFRALWRYGSPILVGLGVFLLSKSLGAIGFLPESLLNEHQRTETVISGFLGVFVTVIAGYCSVWWGRRRTKRMRHESALLYQAAKHDYERAKSASYDALWHAACRHWRDYTGEDWGEKPAFARAMNEDLLMAEQYGRLMQATTVGDVEVIFNVVREKLRVRFRNNRVNRQTRLSPTDL